MSAESVQGDVPWFDLPAEVFRLVRQIPRGEFTTYAELARALGDEKSRSARWLGELLHHHTHTPDCPCHRVVRSTGETGLHVSDDPALKITLLQQEGVAVTAGKVNVAQRWAEFQRFKPLAQLREWQQSLAANVKQTPLPHPVRTLGGLDVAYPEPGLAQGAYVRSNAATLAVEYELIIRWPVSFPYIPGYLTFRELPVLRELLQQVRTAGQLADVLLVDGNGQLHPWRAGIATCLGVLENHPVIGVTKSLLCGNVVAESDSTTRSPITIDEETIGWQLRAPTGGQLVYVSVGNRITLKDAVSIVAGSYADHRLPEPIWRADKLTKQRPL